MPITPLISLRTNLKSLKYGNDLPGYGSSNQPFIQTNIPNDFVADPLQTNGNTNPIFKPTTTGGVDYPIRGAGNRELAIGGVVYSISNQIDYNRIKKFLESKPRGNAFLEKQIGLQLSNPKIETGNTLFGQFNLQILPGLIENTRVYNNGRNTLEQIKNQGNSIHIPRLGATPYNYLEKFYSDIVGSQNLNDDSSTNRLLILQKMKMTSSPDVVIDSVNNNLVNKLGISYNKNMIFQYLGGPGSTYGIGSTIIKRTEDTTVTKLGSSYTLSYDKLLNKTGTPGRTDNISDFRLDVVDPSSVKGTPWDYAKDSLDYKFYVKAGEYKDKMNKLMPYIFNSSETPWSLPIIDEANKDIIKFVFECVSNDNPEDSVAIFFRAFLTAGLTDNHNAELNAFKYMGRGETFYTYQGFNRSTSFSFRIAAGSAEELKPLYSKLNRLISQVYPDYSKNGVMRAPLVKITVGDYLYRMPGFIESINVTVDNGATWEIEEGQQLPQYLDVAVSFKPIFNNLPRRSTETGQMAILTNPDLSSLDTGNLLRFTTNARDIIDTISNFNSNLA
jgi:hypothetical protein